MCGYGPLQQAFATAGTAVVDIRQGWGKELEERSTQYRHRSWRFGPIRED
jgi:hypothetical protein